LKEAGIEYKEKSKVLTQGASEKDIVYAALEDIMC